MHTKQTRNDYQFYKIKREKNYRIDFDMSDWKAKKKHIKQDVLYSYYFYTMPHEKNFEEKAYFAH